MLRSLGSHPGGFELLLECTEVTRPDIHRVAEKIGSRSSILDQKFAEPSTTLASITRSAGRNQVPTGLIPSTHLRLNVVNREVGWLKHLSAIDTPPAIPSEDVEAMHRGLGALRELGNKL